MEYLNEQERAFKGVWIPASIWLNESLTVMEKVLYAEIDSFCTKGRECFCSNAHFAKLLQVSERQVQRLLGSLEKKGFISKRMVYTEGGAKVERRYLKPVLVTPPPDNIVTPPPDNIVTPPPDKNVVDTNTVTTNTVTTNTNYPPQEEEDGWQTVIHLYENNIRPLTSRIELDKLYSLYTDYGQMWLSAAITEAVENGAHNIKYIAAILDRWKVDGFKADRRAKKTQAKKDAAPPEKSTIRDGIDWSRFDG